MLVLVEWTASHSCPPYQQSCLSVAAVASSLCTGSPQPPILSALAGICSFPRVQTLSKKSNFFPGCSVTSVGNFWSADFSNQLRKFSACHTHVNTNVSSPGCIQISFSGSSHCRFPVLLSCLTVSLSHRVLASVTKATDCSFLVATCLYSLALSVRRCPVWEDLAAWLARYREPSLLSSGSVSKVSCDHASPAGLLPAPLHLCCAGKTQVPALPESAWTSLPLLKNHFQGPSPSSIYL